MPDGRTHNIACGILAVGTTFALPLTLATWGNDAFAIPLGCLSGILLSPDLDVDQGNESDAIIRGKFGVVPQFMWRVFWFPYAKLVPHRSLVSHFPGIGTAIRLIYMFGMLFLPFVLCATYAPGIESIIYGVIGSTAFWLWVMGLAIADLGHAILDAVF